MKNFLKKLLHGVQQRYELMVEFHMKSGKSIFVLCDDITIERNGTTLTSVNLTGVKKCQFFHVDMSQVEAVTYEKFGRYA